MVRGLVIGRAIDVDETPKSRRLCSTALSKFAEELAPTEISRIRRGLELDQILARVDIYAELAGVQPSSSSRRTSRL